MTVLLLITGMALGIFFILLLWVLLRRADVVLRFKKIHPLITTGGFFWSINVANVGSKVATGCIGAITINNLTCDDMMEPAEGCAGEELPCYAEEDEDGRVRRPQFLTPHTFRQTTNMPLCWSISGNPFCMDIHPGMAQYLDICKIQHNSERGFWYFIIASEKGWRSVRLRMKLKPLSGRLVVSPSNEFPTVLDFKITITPDGQPEFVVLSQSWFSRFWRHCTRQYWVE